MALKDLSKNVNFVNENRELLLESHRGKYLLVYDGELVDAYDSYANAATEGVRRYGMDGNFLVYQILEQSPLNFVMSANL
jgi:hypothetical protein